MKRLILAVLCLAALSGGVYAQTDTLNWWGRPCTLSQANDTVSAMSDNGFLDEFVGYVEEFTGELSPSRLRGIALDINDMHERWWEAVENDFSHCEYSARLAYVLDDSIDELLIIALMGYSGELEDRAAFTQLARDRTAYAMQSFELMHDLTAAELDRLTDG